MSEPRLTQDSFYTIATVTYRWQCAVCGAVEVEETQVLNGGYLMTPYRFPTNDWKLIANGQGTDLCCPKHDVTLLVDGKPWPTT